MAAPAGEGQSEGRVPPHPDCVSSAGPAVLVELRDRMERATPPVTVLVASAAVAAPALLGVAIFSFVRSGPDRHVLVSVLALALAAGVAEHYPVPIEGVDTRGISLSAVLIVGTVVLFGWAPAVLVAAVASTLQLLAGRPPLRVGYNV